MSIIFLIYSFRSNIILKFEISQNFNPIQIENTKEYEMDFIHRFDWIFGFQIFCFTLTSTR